MKKICKYLSIMLLALVSSCSDSSNSNSNGLSSDTLRIGLSPDYPPFELVKDHQIVGLDIDMSNEIATKLNKKLEIVDMDFDGLIPALDSGRIDCIVSGMTATEERMKNVDFSVEYYSPQFAMLYRKDNPIASLEACAGATIGVQLGTSMETYLKDKSLQIANMNLVALKKYTTMVQELVLNRFDGVFMETAQAKAFINRYPELAYSQFDVKNMGYAIAFAKNSPLKKPVDEIIIHLRDSGEMAKIEEKWLSGESKE